MAASSTVRLSDRLFPPLLRFGSWPI